MAKLRTCKICGKQYEYCGHCPSKNLIEPWRNLYCSENCRETFQIMGQYSAGKIKATEARAKLESFGIKPGKVRDAHKAIVADIFRAGKQEPKFSEAIFEKEVTPIFTESVEPVVAVLPTESISTLEPEPIPTESIVEKTPVAEVKVAVSEERKSFKKRRNFEKKENNIVNGDLN